MTTFRAYYPEIEGFYVELNDKPSGYDLSVIKDVDAKEEAFSHNVTALIKGWHGLTERDWFKLVERKELIADIFRQIWGYNVAPDAWILKKLESQLDDREMQFTENGAILLCAVSDRFQRFIMDCYREES